jgi:hypothetical protein
MGNVSFFTDPLDAQAVEQDEGTTSDEQRLTTFYQDGMTLEKGDAGSLLDRLEKAVEECEFYRNGCKAYYDAIVVMYDDFVAKHAQFLTEIYMGGYASPPTLGYFGDALVPGVLYYDTSLTEVYVWTGSVWQVYASQIGPIGKIGPAGIPPI